MALKSLAFVLMLTLHVARPAGAQAYGQLEGTVTDSVHARPLAGARVVAAGTGSRSEVRAEARTDSAGRYRLDSLPVGQYVVGFENALLDSLEIAVSPRGATVAPGQLATLDLALPSAAKLRSAVCLGVTLPAEAGVIYGHVVSAESESPLAGVGIAVAWRDLSVEKKERVRAISRDRSESLVTDENGWYRLCGVPTGTWVSMQVQDSARSSPVLRTRIDDTLGIAIRHFSLSTAGPGATTADDRAGARLWGTATLSGIVRGPGDAPIASAEVRVRGARTGASRTDAMGAFALGNLPGGSQELEVRRVGYALEVVPVELRSGATTTVLVRMQRIVNLDSVVIVASRPKYPEFYAHKSAGWGRFLGPEEIAKQRVSRTSDIIQKLPGFLVQEMGYRSIVVAMGGMGMGMCPSTVVIDGMRVHEYPPNVNDVHPLDVAAIEAYPPNHAFMAPPEYHIGGCGGVVIWTKR